MTSQAHRVEQAWKLLIDSYHLNDTQINQFKTYLDLLLQWNEQINLTAIVQPHQVIMDHFLDSLAVSKVTSLDAIQSIADVGSGAGFPGIPLKIVYPHLNVLLIEVTGKKIAFLRTVIEQLGLEDIDIYTLDWRTFLRTTQGQIDLFLSRASLVPEELLRVFKPSSAYNQATMIYWASKLWQTSPEEAPFITQEYDYQVGNKKRRLIIFKKPA